MTLQSLLHINNIYIFCILSFVLLIVYGLSKKAIRKSRMANNQKRSMVSKLKFLIIITLIILILTLWATELYQFIISIAAIGAAIAITTKEVFLCFGGGFYRAFAYPFTIGDRIEVNNVRGDVVDIGLLGTQILEVGPKDLTHQYTGRTVTIPNSIFLTNYVLNESETGKSEKDYALHVFIVPIKNDIHWAEHKNFLLNAAKEVCNEHVDAAKDYFKRLAKKRQVDMPLIEPRITIKFHTPEVLNLIVRVTIPVARKGLIEQEIINKYLEKSYHE